MFHFVQILWNATMYQSFFPFIIISFDQNNKKQIPILLA